MKKSGDSQGRNEGGKGGTIPRSPNHCGAPKSPKMSQVLPSVQ